MSVQMQTLSREELGELISQKITPTMSEDSSEIFSRIALVTTVVWGGKIGGEIKCLWGLVPPTLLSDEAYLWLHVLEPVEEYEFVFVRYSQQAIAEALERFPVIKGHCEVGASRSIRWIKWLGGKFSEPQGRMIPFEIRKRTNG